MNRFAKELDNIIKKRQISNLKAGKLINIDPSLLRRYRKGERIPRSDSIVDQVNEGLSLSLTEQSSLAYALTITRNPINYQNVTTEEILGILEQGTDSSILAIEEYVCQDNDFSRSEDQKMVGLNDINQIQNALSYIGRFAKENNLKVYVLSELLRKKEKLSPVISFKVPDLQETEQVIVINHYMDQYHLLVSYIQHSGISNDRKKHSYHIYRTNTSIKLSDSWLLLSDEFVLKYDIYADTVSGYLSFDPNVIQHHKNIYDRYRQKSKKQEGNVKNIFSNLIRKAR
ncbi:MAG: hypothetical protein Q4E53_03530 [Eubacteriales bacterium]|nr:hypothetical protein [Eubacteriales bacterium]